ncbi:MAG: S8 family peptidase [Deltaproteobacteria bacterium]|nr:S8 family peptidase [Deltaproteobacteria bacterium]
MDTTRKHPHIIVPWQAKTESYQSYSSGRKTKTEPPSVGRHSHGVYLQASINRAVDEARARRGLTSIEVIGAKPGVYLEFESFQGWELAIGSFENRRAKDPRKHIEVVAVSTEVVGQGADAEEIQYAAVIVPDGQVGHFLSQLERYARTTPKKPRERRHESVYDRVSKVRLAALRSLWTDARDVYPSSEDESIWWEVWLRRTDGEELQRFLEFASQTRLKVSPRRIQFDERIVTLVHGTARQLAASLDVINDLAELQRAKETASFFVEQSPKEQADWVKDLLERMTPPSGESPSVCILDTGVNRGHPLLEHALAPQDCHTVDPNWGSNDHDGHGTEMAGLALYGDLVPLLAGKEPVRLGHGLESVKILPPTGQNDPELYGAVTAEAAGRVEVQSPTRRRVFSMAITSRDTRDRGKPTSWSSAIDALAAGRSFDPSTKGLVYLDDDEPHRRLFIVCAGNVDEMEPDHLARSDTEPIHDPAQAWNALTVGAYTDKVIIQDLAWNDWEPVAQRGDLSPWSTTSVTFEKQWPFKPDIVMEGGNIVRDDKGTVDFPCEDLSLLTTYFKPTEKPFVLSWATSPATAQAARIAASIAAAYPDLWPEMIRGLVVHSAEWTPVMKKNLDATNDRKRARARLVRRYGFGVPSLDRALRSADNSATLLVQGSIRPFEDGKLREMHFYELPWPREVLASLGDANVRVRVTLSYFIEPNPGRRGWKKRHRYQSHGLRFDVKGPTESLDEFRKRLNKKALDEEEEKPSTSGDSKDWYLGEQARNHGSLHSDILEGLAADIAERGVVAVYPVTGWWKEQKKQDRSEYGTRYALIVSIETEDIETDIYTPIAVQVGLPVETFVG